MVLDTKIQHLKDHFGITRPEDWSAVDGFPGYYVTKDGRAYSTIKRNGQKPGIIDGSAPRQLKPLVLSATGYLAVNLHRDGIQKTVLLHELVATAFHGKRPGGAVCCHSNGIRTDNRTSNLRWGTRSENEADKLLHGTRPIGESHSNAILTEIKVAEIYRAAGKQRDIAKRFGISQAQVNNIKCRRQWRHVTNA